MAQHGAVLDGIAEGLSESRYTHFVEMDADFSHLPEELPRLLAEATRFDVVIGSRYIRGSQISNWPRRRRVFSFLANRIARSMLKVPYLAAVP